MKITFTLTKQDSWSYHKYETGRAILQYPLLYIMMYALSAVILWLGWAAFLHLFERDFLYCLTLGLLNCILGLAWYGFSARSRHFKELTSNPAWIGYKVVELGKFDLFWGTSENTGRYYHWSVLSDTIETSRYFYLTLRGCNVFIIPKSAFSSSAEAQVFGTEVRGRWEAAKQKQRYQEQEVEGTWPPAPRPGA